MARVQTPDLAAPDPIRPAAVSAAPTFAAPAPPPIDNSLSQLAEGLGAFNRGLMMMHGKWAEEDKKRRLEALSADHDRWLASTTSDEQLQLYRAGKAPGQMDPLWRRAVVGHHGYLEAKALGDRVQKEWEEGKIPYSDPSFSIEKYILDQANPTVERYGRDADFIGSYRKGLDAIRGRMGETRERALAAAAEQQAKQVATDNFRDLIDKIAITNAENPDQQVDGQTALGLLRQIVKDTGPRMNGGSLGIKYTQGEAYLLEVLEEKAGDVRYARLIDSVLKADREDLLGTGVKLGSFVDDARYGQAARAIQKKVIATAAAHTKQQYLKAFEQDLDRAFERGDTSFSALLLERKMAGDAVNPVDGSKIEFNVEEMEKAAQQRWLARQRQRGGIDIKAEAAAFAANGKDHYQVVGALQSAYIAAVSVPPGKDTAPAAQKFMEAAEMFRKHMDVSPNGLTSLTREQRQMYEAYTTMTQIMGVDANQAAQSLIRTMSDPISRRDPNAESGRMQEIQRAVDRINGNQNFWGGLPGFRDIPENRGYLLGQAKEIANLIVQTQMIPADEAIKKAVEILNKRAVFVNGQAIVGVPHMTQQDGETAKALLGKVYERFKDTLAMPENGVTSPDQLVLFKGPNNELQVWSRSSRMPIRVVDPANVAGPGAEMAPTLPKFIQFQINDIKRFGAMAQAQKVAEEDKKKLDSGRAASIVETILDRPAYNAEDAPSYRDALSGAGGALDSLNEALGGIWGERRRKRLEGYGAE